MEKSNNKILINNTINNTQIDIRKTKMPNKTHI